MDLSLHLSSPFFRILLPCIFYDLTSHFLFPSVNISTGLMCTLQMPAIAVTAHIGGHAHLFFFHHALLILRPFLIHLAQSFESKEDMLLQVKRRLRKAVCLSMNSVFESGSSMPVVHKQNLDVDY